MIIASHNELCLLPDNKTNSSLDISGSTPLTFNNVDKSKGYNKCYWVE